MSRYMLIRRLRAPAILLLIGILALLHQMGAIPYFWQLLWPLLLILLGLLLLAERAALAAEGYPIFPWGPWNEAGQGTSQGTNQGPNQGMSQGTIQGAPFPGAGQGEAPTGALVVPSHPHDFENGQEGGKS